MTGLDFGGERLRQNALGAQPAQDPEVARFLDYERQRTEQRAFSSYQLAVREDPNTRAEAQRIGADLGVPAESVANDVATFRQLQQVKALRNREIAKSNPLLAEMMGDLEFARITHDDVDALSTVEQMFTAWDRGQLTSERGELRHQEMNSGLTKAQKARLDEIEARLLKMPAVEGFLPNASEIVSQFTASPLPAIGGVGGAVVGGLVAGPPGAAVGFGLGFQGMSAFQTLRVESGNWYGDALQKGMDPETAKRVAGYVGLANAALEVVGTRLAAAPIRAAVKTKLAKWATEKVMQQAVRVSPGGSIITGISKEAAEALARPTIAEAAKRFAKGYTVGVASETGEEIAQELVNVLGDDAARIFGGQGDKQTWTEALAQVMEVGMKAAQGMALVGVGSPSVRLFMDGVQIREAERAKEFLLSVQEAAKQSKTLPRSPVTFERLVAATAKQSNAETVYVDAREFKNVLEQTGLTPQELGQAVPELAEQLSQLDALVQQGGDVTMPTAKWASSISVRPQLSDALLPHMRLSQEAFSPAEAETRVREIAEKVKKQATQTVEDMDAMRKQWQGEVQELKEEFRSELRRVGRLPEQAEVESQAYSNFVARMSEALNTSPRQFASAFGVKVAQEGQAVESPTLFQDGQRRTDTPEFKAWFGKSEIGDELGRPLVVYHATGADFTGFRADGFRGAAFFSETPDGALRGATASAVEGVGTGGTKVIPVYLSAERVYGRSYTLPPGVSDPSGTYDTEAEAVAALDKSADEIRGKDWTGDRKLNEWATEIALRQLRENFVDEVRDGKFVIRKSAKPSEVRGSQRVDLGDTPMGWQTFERGPTNDMAGTAPGRRVLRALGYDGALIGDEGGTSYAVFDPTQIKSVNNRGTWDPTDPNILRQEGVPEEQLVDKFGVATMKLRRQWQGAETGEPVELVAWHAEGGTWRSQLTDEVREQLGRDTELGAGWYGARDLDVAKTYGDAKPYVVTLQNPFVIRANSRSHVKQLTNAELEKIRSDGHDGIVVTNWKSIAVNNEDRGQLQVVAFNEAAVRPYEAGTLRQEGVPTDRTDTPPNLAAVAGGPEARTLQVDQLVSASEIPTITLQDLVGKKLFPTIADRTAAAAVYTGIDSSQTVAIEMLGGPMFPLRRSNWLANIVWANRGKSVTSAKQAKLAAGARYMMVVLGDADMHASNTTVANVAFATLEAYARDGRISKANARKLTRLLKDRAGLKGFPGFDDLGKLDAYLHGLTFEQRDRVLEVLGSAAAVELGAPSMRRILDATREPSMAGGRWGDGVLVLELDEQAPFVKLGEEGTRPHPDFPLGIRGRVVGKLATPVSYELLWQDWLKSKAQQKAQQGVAETNLRRSFQLALPELEVTQDLVDRIGPIDSPNIDGPRQAKLAVDMASGKWRVSNKPVKEGGASVADFVAAVRDSEARVVLDEYTEKQVSAEVRGERMRLFQLDEDSGIWFGLKRGEPASGYGLDAAKLGLGPEDVTLTAVVNNEQGARGIAGPAVVLKAIEEGVTVLDCFAVKSPKFPQGFLPKLYGEFGFQVVAEVPFDPSYYSQQKLADAEKFWSSTGWDKSRDGYPAVVVMKWNGDADARRNATRRFLRDGLEGVGQGGVSSDARAGHAALRGDVAAAATAGGASPNGGRVAGAEGVGNRAPLASRARSVVQAVAGLTDAQAANLGLDPADVAEARRAARSDGRLNQEGDTIERGPARGQFSPIDLTLIFRKDSDASTGWHELSHYFLEVYTRIAMQPDAPASVREDMQVLLDWFGIKDIETWAAMSVEQQAPFHEQFAYNWEKWAFEGRAPSRGLARLFEKMRAFLIAAYKNGVLETIDAIYQRTFKKPLPSLTDEVRGVMGRMVAAEDAVARAEVARDIAPLFQTQEQSGMSDAEWADWQEAQRMAHEAAVTDLTTASLKQMQWLEGARTRVLKQLQKEFKAARAEAKEQAERELAAVPVYRAIRYLKYGELTGPDGERIPGDKDANHKLNTTAVQRIATGGKDTAKLRGMMAKDGLAPDTVAVLFGYKDGAELVNALLDAQPQDDAVQQRATEIVAARQDVVDIDGDPRKVSAFVEMALHNDARARATAVTLRWLEKQGQPVRLYIAGAKLAAKEAMRARKVGDIRPRQHVLAAQRARKDAAKLTQKGQMLDAADAVRRELLQLEMVREANEAREAIDKGLALFDKFRQADEDIGPSRDIDVVEEGRTILKARGLWDAAADAHENLTFDDFQALVAELRGKWDKAKADRNIEIEGRKAAVADFATEAAKELIARGLPENIADKGTPTAAELKLDDMHSDSSSWARVEHYFRRLDGGKVGPWSRMYQRVSKSMLAYRAAMRKETEALKKIIDGMDTKRPETIRFTRPDGTVFEFGRGNGGLGKAELLGAIAHMGNASNYRKLIVGRRFGVVNEDGTVDDTLWRAFIAKMQRGGILTEKDYQGIQAIWDLLEAIKPRLQKTHKALYGYEFEEVEADPVVTPWGVFRGGYIPAMRDRFAVRDTVMTITEIRDEVRQAMPSAESGFTKSRVEGYARELSLDLAQLTGHLDTTLRWAYVQPVVSDLQRVYNHKNLAGTMERFDRNMRRDILIPWLDRISRGRTTLPGKSKLADGFFRWIRNTSPLAVMFGNIANAMQNFTGLANARAVLGKGHVAHATWQLTTNFKETYEFIYGKSSWLNERKQRSIAEHFDDIREALTDQGAWRRGQLAAKKHAYFLQRLTQQPVDAIVWLAAYNKRMSALDPDSDSIAEVEAEAVAYADSVVRETQGSSEVEDISAWEVNTEWGKLLTQFTGWAQNWFQANMNQARTTWEQSANKAQASWKLLGQAWWALFVPAAVGAAIKMLWTGDYNDDDDAYDEAFDLLVAAPTKMALGGIPMVNVVTNAAYNFFFDGVGYNDRLPTAPAISALERAIMGTKGLFENGATGREIRSLGDLATLILGFPISTVAKPIGYAVDVAEGRVQPTGVWDAVRGAITGQASPGSRAGR